MIQKSKEWIENKLLVRGYPVIKEIEPGGRYCTYDIFINVSDEFHLGYSSKIRQLGKDSFWFPMGECEKDMGINSMFGALQVLFQACMEDKSVLLHCHAGANRSPTVRAAFYFMMTATHREEKWEDGTIRRNMLILNCGKHLPPQDQMEKWLGACREAFDNPDKFLGGMYDYTLRKSGIEKYLDPNG